MVEMQRRMAARREELHVDWEEEGEAEERDDDEVDETDAHSRGHICGAEWAEIEGGEADSWRDSLWYCCKIRSWDRIVLH